MQSPELDVLLTARPEAEKRVCHRSSNVEFWIVAVLIVVVAAAAIGAAALVSSRADGNRSQAAVSAAATDERHDTPPGGQVEQQVRTFLADGQQSQAETLLQVRVARLPEALTLAQLLAAGKTREAERFLDVHREELRAAQRVLFLFAVCKRSRFDKATSLAVFNTVHTIDPTTPAGQCARCVTWLDTLEPGKISLLEVLRAFAEFRKVVAAHPGDIMIRWMLAVQCRSWHRAAEGAKLYEQILEKWDPGPALVHQTYANLLDELGRYDAALGERYKVVKIEPASWSYDGLGNTLDSLERFKEAQKAHQTAVRLNPMSSTHWSNWAFSLQGDKQYDASIEKCRRALELEPRSWRAYWVWGQSLAGQGKLRAALAKYQRGLAIYPGAIHMRKQAAELEQQLRAGR